MNRLLLLQPSPRICFSSSVQRNLRSFQRRADAPLHWTFDAEPSYQDFLHPLLEGKMEKDQDDDDDDAPPARGTSPVNQLRDLVPSPEIRHSTDLLYKTLFQRRPHVQFAGSVFQTHQLPHLGATAEIGIIGRSNVGKSSLINALLQSPDIANHSSTPGRTQSLNLYQLGCVTPQHTVHSRPEIRLRNLKLRVHRAAGMSGGENLLRRAKQRLRRVRQKQDSVQGEAGDFTIPGTSLVPYIVDLPGYGFAQAPKPLIGKWTALMRDYLAGRVVLPSPEKQSETTQPQRPKPHSGRRRPKHGLTQGKQQIYADLYERLRAHVEAQEEKEEGQTASRARDAAPRAKVEMYRDNLKCMLVLLDARRKGLTDLDHEWLQRMQELGVPVQVVLTKADQVRAQALERTALDLSRDLQIYPVCRPLIHAVSSHYKLGLEELRWSICHIFTEAALESRGGKDHATTTTEENELLEEEEEEEEEEDLFIDRSSIPRS